MAKDDFMSMLEEDANEETKLKNLGTELHTVAEMVVELQNMDNRLALLEQQTKDAKAERYKMVTETLPALLAELNMNEIKMDDGSVLTVKQVVAGSIKVDDRPQAYQWLRDNGHGDLVKHVESVAFGAGEDNVAQETKELLSAHLAKNTSGLAVDDKETVHNQTLNAFLRKMNEDGEEIPAFFNPFISQEAKLKGVKK